MLEYKLTKLLKQFYRLLGALTACVLFGLLSAFSLPNLYLDVYFMSLSTFLVFYLALLVYWYKKRFDLNEGKWHRFIRVNQAVGWLILILYPANMMFVVYKAAIEYSAIVFKLGNMSEKLKRLANLPFGCDSVHYSAVWNLFCNILYYYQTEGNTESE